MALFDLPWRRTARLAALPAPADAALEPVHGTLFQSAILPLADGEDGRMWRTAVREAAGWRVVETVQRTGDAAERVQTAVLDRQDFSQAVRQVLGWEGLQRAQGLAPVPEGDASALGYRHVARFLAREGLVCDDGGFPRRFDLASDRVEGTGRFSEADIAAARAHALPLGLGHGLGTRAQPATPLLDFSIVRSDGTLDPKQIEGHESSVRIWIGDRDSEGALNWMLEKLSSRPSEVLAGLLSAPVYGHSYTPRDLASLCVAALAHSEPRIAAAALHLGAALPTMGLVPIERSDDGGRALRNAIYRLGNPDMTEAVALLLDLGLPANSRFGEKLLQRAIDARSPATVDMLAARLDEKTLMRACASEAGDILANPAVMQVLLRRGLPEAALHSRAGTLLECLAEAGNEAGLAVALASGVNFHAPGKGARSLVGLTLLGGHAPAARRLLAAGYTRLLTPAQLAADFKLAVDRHSEVAPLLLDLHPALSAQMDNPVLLAAMAAGQPGPLLQRVLARRELELPLCDALLRAGSPDSLAAGLERHLGFAVAMALDPAGIGEALLRPDRREVPLLLLRHGGAIANAVADAMALRGDGCAIRCAVALGSAELVTALRRHGVEMAATEAGTPSALHDAVRAAPVEVIAAVADGLLPWQLDARDGSEATPLILAARNGRLDAVDLLCRTAASRHAFDASGHDAGFYADMLGDAEMAARLRTLPAVTGPAAAKVGYRWPTPPKPRFRWQ